MEDELNDEQIIDKAVGMLKEKGIFDQIRKNCLEDINTKSSFLNLNQKIEGFVKNFLNHEEWNYSLNKNQLRERLRKDINDNSGIKSGVIHLVEQVINPISFESKIEEQIREIIGINEDELNDEREKLKNENIKFDDKLDDISDDDLFDKETDKLNDNKIKLEHFDINETSIKQEKYYDSSISCSSSDLDYID